jgi:hypothetical protein
MEMMIKVTILSINQMKKKISFVEVNVLDFSSYNKTANEILNNSIESNSNNSESSIYNHSDERDESDDCI